MAALVMLASVPSEYAIGRSVVDAWIVVIILAREIWVTGLKSSCCNKWNSSSCKSKW